MRLSVPLSRRPLDIVFLGFFVFNLLFVSYVISIEQILIRNPADSAGALWPPGGALALIHWWEKTYDPLLWARPAWYRATIWIDVLVFGPFYAAAIYAFARGRAWIRTPCFVWAGMMLSNVIIILFDELAGVHASSRPGIVVGANLSWIVFPLLILWRMGKSPHPFSNAADAATE